MRPTVKEIARSGLCHTVPAERPHSVHHPIPFPAPETDVPLHHRDISPPRGWIFFLSLLVIAGVLFGTLIPMPYHRVPPDAPFAEGYRYFSWAFTPYRDLVSNVLLFIPVGLFLWASAACVMRRGFALPVAALLSALLSVAIEWTQVFVPGRYPCAIDVGMNSLGALIGAKSAALALEFATAMFRMASSIAGRRAKVTAPAKDSDRLAA
jgi:hypothetical protein